MPVLAALGHLRGQAVLDVGCGNGAFASSLAGRGARLVGIDVSPSGVERARDAFPHLEWRILSAYDDLRGVLGREFDAVVAVEVIEHLFDPRQFLTRAFEVLKPGGKLVLSTPYHGYLKNLALALTGRLDAHFTVLWDGGHVKFFSRRTLGTMVEDAGFTKTRLQGAGRVPFLWKSMVLSATRPGVGPEAG